MIVNLIVKCIPNCLTGKLPCTVRMFSTTLVSYYGHSFTKLVGYLQKAEIHNNWGGFGRRYIHNKVYFMVKFCMINFTFRADSIDMTHTVTGGLKNHGTLLTFISPKWCESSLEENALNDFVTKSKLYRSSLKDCVRPVL